MAANELILTAIKKKTYERTPPGPFLIQPDVSLWRLIEGYNYYLFSNRVYKFAVSFMSFLLLQRI